MTTVRVSFEGDSDSHQIKVPEGYIELLRMFCRHEEKSIEEAFDMLFASFASYMISILRGDWQSLLVNAVSAVGHIMQDMAGAQEDELRDVIKESCPD